MGMKLMRGGGGKWNSFNLKKQKKKTKKKKQLHVYVIYRGIFCAQILHNVPK